MVLPGGHIQIKPARLEVFPVAFVIGLAEQVAQPPLVSAKIREREPDITLAGVTGIVHGDKQPGAVGILPSKSDEILE